MATIRDTRDLNDASKAQLKTAIETFKSTFRPSVD